MDAFVPGAERDSGRTPEEELQARRFATALNRARRGWLGFFESDRVCIDHLGVHPSDVFGLDWIDMPDDTELQAHLRSLTDSEEVAA